MKFSGLVINSFPQPSARGPQWFCVLDRVILLIAWVFVAASWTGESLAELGRFSGAGMIAATALLLGVGAMIFLWSPVVRRGDCATAVDCRSALPFGAD